MLTLYPNWCESIVEGEQTIVITKQRPLLKKPFRCYIYCAKSRSGHKRYTLSPFGYLFSEKPLGCATEIAEGKVIGEFVCKHIERIIPDDVTGEYDTNGTGMSQEEIMTFGDGYDLFGLEISELNLYEEPLETKEFKSRAAASDRECPSRLKGMCVRTGEKCYGCHYKTLTRAPQSYCYVYFEDENDGENI